MGCLYKLTSPNGKSYIGISSKGLDARWAKHVEHAIGKRTNGALYAALRKYGPDAFTRVVLAEEAEWGTLCEMEKRAIIEHGTFAPGGYNVTPGGEGTLGPISPEARERVAAAQKKRFEDPEERRKLLEQGAKGRAITSAKAEVRKAARKAYLASPEFKQAHAAATKAGMADPEVQRKVREKAKARAADPAWREKISASRAGMILGPQSESHRQAISDARKREWADPVMREKRLGALAKARAAKTNKGND